MCWTKCWSLSGQPFHDMAKLRFATAYCEICTKGDIVEVDESSAAKTSEDHRSCNSRPASSSSVPSRMSCRDGRMGDR